MAGFCYFDVKVDTSNVIEDVWGILQSLNPHWNRRNLKQQEYTGGMINSITCFYQRTDEKRSDAVIVRVYGLEGNTLIDREVELLSIQIAHAVGCFPTVLATFQNGLVYKYAPGRAANFHDVTNPRVIRQVSEKLYKLHHVDVNSVKLFDRKGNPVAYKFKPRMVDTFPSLINAIPDKPNNAGKVDTFNKARSILTDEYLTHEYEHIKDTIDAVHLEISPVHGDFRPRNIIIDDATGDVTFVDYEMAGMYYQIADLALLFHSKPGYTKMGFTSPGEPDMTEEVCQLYIREYLGCRDESSTSNVLRVADEEVERLYIHARIAWIVNRFFILLLVLSNADLESKGGYIVLDFLMGIIEQYKDLRGELLELREKCVTLDANRRIGSMQ